MKEHTHVFVPKIVSEPEEKTGKNIGLVGILEVLKR